MKTTRKQLKKELQDFLEYCNDFYGINGTSDIVYSKSEIRVAINQYLRNLLTDKIQTWGGGDSIDRERVHEILENQRQKDQQSLQHIFTTQRSAV
jgi:hypothetical protein